MNTFHASSIEEIRVALRDPDIDVITVEPGDYFVSDDDRGQGFVIGRDVTITSSVPGEHANFYARSEFTKGIFLVESGASATFDTIGFHDTRGAYGPFQQGNEAGIRHEGDALTIRNSHFEGNSNGILGTETDTRPGKELVIENSVFDDNGRTDQEHHVYFIGESASVSGSRFTNSHNGHAVKTVVSDYTRITDSFIDDAGSRANAAIDVTGGGDLLVSGNEIHKSATSENPYVIFYVPQRGHDGGEIVIENNTINTEWNGSTAGTLLLGNFSSSPAQLSDNTLTGTFAHNLIYGAAEDSGSTINGAALSGDLWINSATALTGGDDVYIDDDSVRNPELYEDRTVQAVNGGAGNDQLRGQAGDRDIDVFFGGEGNDFIDGGGGIDFLYGGVGDDIILTGTSSAISPVDFASGGGGNDWIVVGSDTSSELSAAYVSGGEGDDIIDASRAYTGIFSGDAGNDIILGASYRDWLSGGSGDDYLFGGESFDQLHGGGGIDTAIYEGEYGVDLRAEADYRDGDVRIIAIDPGNTEIGTVGQELVRSIEYVQFSNGVLDTSTFTFTEGAERIDLDSLLSRDIPTEDDLAGTAPVPDAPTPDDPATVLPDENRVETETLQNGSLIERIFKDGVLRTETVTEADRDVSVTEFNEEGVRESYIFNDISDSRLWDIYSEVFDTDTGIIRSSERLLDNGDTRVTFFNEDGVRESVEFTDVSDRKSFETSRTIYDEDTGLISEREQLLDNGNMRNFEFIDGIRARRTITETDGDYSILLFNDEGVRETLTYFDVSDTRHWNSFTNTYDTDTGELISREFMLDFV